MVPEPVEPGLVEPEPVAREPELAVLELGLAVLRKTEPYSYPCSQPKPAW